MNTFASKFLAVVVIWASVWLANNVSAFQRNQSAVASTAEVESSGGQEKSENKPESKIKGESEVKTVGKSDNKLIDRHHLRHTDSTEVLLSKSELAIQRGLDYLVASQNPDGSWGSHDPRLARMSSFAFSITNRGAHDAVRAACTAICAEAFLAQPKLSATQQSALGKTIEFLTRVPEIDPKTGVRPAEFGFHPGQSFNTWGYGYKLVFLAKLNESKYGQRYRSKIELAAELCVAGLLKQQQHNGGWHYYSGQLKNAGAMSFNTSFFALTLFRAKKMGIEVPKGMIPDAIKIVEKQRVADGSFVYDSRFINKGGSYHLQNLGSAARTISTTFALHEMGVYQSDDLSAAMKIFGDGENYLEMGRKRMSPHSVVHQISGYFFFFGYNYATAAATKLAGSVSQDRWDQFAWTMIRTQEKDGSWWDTPAGDYGTKWGTGFAVQSLQRCVAATKSR